MFVLLVLIFAKGHSQKGRDANLIHRSAAMFVSRRSRVQSVYDTVNVACIGFDMLEVYDAYSDMDDR